MKTSLDRAITLGVAEWPLRAAPFRTDAWSCLMPLLALLSLSLILLPSDTTVVRGTPTVFKFGADIGYVSTSGNSSVQTLNLGDRITAKTGAVTFSQQFNVIHGRSKGQVVTSLWRAALRTDIAVQPTFGVYGSVTYERNVFSGLRSRFGNTLGVTAQVVKTPHDKFSVEGGMSLTAQRGIAGKGRDIDFLGGRAATNYSHQLSNKASFSQSVEFLPNFREQEDLRINAESVLVAPFTKQISVRISYLIRYDGLPEPGFQSTDRLFTSGIQVSL
ncbi:MAG: DUF481 domain-containing protein [Gemmatimonadota bacterium]